MGAVDSVEASIQHMRTGDDFDTPMNQRVAARLVGKEKPSAAVEGHSSLLANPMYPYPVFAMAIPGGMIPVAWNTAGAASWNVVHVPHQATSMYMTSSLPCGWEISHLEVGPAAPRPAAPPAAAAPAAVQTQGGKTTVMLRNIPNNYDRDSFVELLDSQGFSGHYDFIYLPLDFKSRVAIGYAFVNFTSHSVAARAFHTFSGFSTWKGKSRKVCEVTWSETHQGLEANMELVRNSPMNRRRVPEEFKPLIIRNGKRVKLPPPNKRS